MPTSRSLATTVLTAAALLGCAGAHSWLECTDYRVTPGSDATKVWDKSLCLGHARCGQRQANEGFGVDTGFNYHSGSGCQCARGDSNYDGISKAVYTPGQRVCLAYPSKNHVAAPCTNADIPDTGVKITRSAASSATDDDVSRAYTSENGDHVKGEMDYKGFQNCPNFCSNMDKALCTMCFDLEPDLAPGEYTFRWVWSFNSGDDSYSSCWETEVRGSGAYGGDSIPIAGRVHAASDAPPTTPVMATATPTPTQSTSEFPAPTQSSEPPRKEQAGYKADSKTESPEYELDCDENDPTEDPAEGEGEDPECNHPLPVAKDESAVMDPVNAPPPPPPTETPTNAPSSAAPTSASSQQHTETHEPHDDCDVAADEPGVVHGPAYS